MSRKHKLGQKELERIAQKTRLVAKKAGTKLVSKQKKLGSLTITSKQAQGVVSEADIQAEKFIINNLKDVVKDAQFLAEESAFEKHGSKSEAFKAYQKYEYTWIIDPLDGTTNYLNNMDYYGVCICLAHYGKPILGVVYRPRTKQMYWALEDGGAYYQKATQKKKRLKISKVDKKLSDCILATGFACEKGQVFDREFELFIQMMESARGIRRMGSAAIDLCMVAEGIFDGFWEKGLSPWDVAAAGLICQEAGFSLCNYEGKKFHPFRSTIVVSPKKLKTQLLKVLKN